MAEHKWTPDPDGPRIPGTLVSVTEYFAVANDDVVTRLRDVTHANEDGVQVTFAPCAEAADEIERLRTALALACGELSTTDHHYNNHPEPLMQQFLEEARRG